MLEIQTYLLPNFQLDLGRLRFVSYLDPAFLLLRRGLSQQPTDVQVVPVATR
jgi:hypothetical protein